MVTGQDPEGCLLSAVASAARRPAAQQSEDFATTHGRLLPGGFLTARMCGIPREPRISSTLSYNALITGIAACADLEYCSVRDTCHASAARAARLALGRARGGASSVDVKRLCGALHNFPGDHHLLDAFHARQIEHGVEQDTFHDRAQAPRAGLAVDRLAGDGAECFLRQREIDALHLEQPLILLHQRVLWLPEDALES